MAWSYRSQDRKDEVYAQDGGPTTLGNQDGGDGGSSFLSNHTALIDPSGFDTGQNAGVIGDLGKPFLTVQAAITAFENFGGGPPNDALIDIGNNSFSEDLTTSLSEISFTGINETTSYAFNSIHFTAPTGDVALYLRSCACDGISSDTSARLIVEAETASVGSITTTADVILTSDTGNGRQDNGITAGGNVTTQGVYLVGTISAPGFVISIQNSRPVYADSSNGSYFRLPTIDSPGSEVFATGSVIGQVTACGTLHLIDSRVQGTNNAANTVYADVLLNPNNFDWSVLPTVDPVDARKLWVDSGVVKRSAG